MQVERISEEEFFNGMNRRISEMAEDIEETAHKISENPDSSTYHIDNFFYPLNVLRTLQRIRDKARAFKENEDEDLVYVKKTVQGEPSKYYYLPQSQYDKSRLGDILRKMEQRESTSRDTDLGYIN